MQLRGKVSALHGTVLIYSYGAHSGGQFYTKATAVNGLFYAVVKSNGQFKMFRMIFCRQKQISAQNAALNGQWEGSDRQVGLFQFFLTRPLKNPTQET